MARSLRSLAGGLYGGVQEFQVRTYIIIITQILLFFGKGEILIRDSFTIRKLKIRKNL